MDIYPLQAVEHFASLVAMISKRIRNQEAKINQYVSVTLAIKGFPIAGLVNATRF